jgi:purine nucleosidase
MIYLAASWHIHSRIRRSTLAKQKTEKVIFDTDIGSDIDDAVALAWLLANPACELVGITTVSGQPIERAQLASALCEVAGKDIPIIPQQAPSLQRWNHQQRYPDIAATDFLADTIERNSGEVTLLAVGPMTNVSNLFERHPESAQHLKQVVLMCGRFGEEQIGNRAGEWNVYCDPHAAQAVLNTPTRRMRAHGLDVTTRVRMEQSEVRKHFRHPLLAPVLDMAEEWFSRRPLITFHDPLAAVAMFNENLCTYERGFADVLLEHGDEQGLTTWTPGEGGPLEVGVSVDVEGFFDTYFGMFS